MNGSFFTRAVSFAAIAVMLLGYNQVLYAREKDEEAARQAAEEAAAEAAEAAGIALTTDYEDGTWTGSGQGFGGIITVEVTIEDGSITAIDVTGHSGEDGAYYSEAEQMIDDIISAQSADVDTISGATFSSTGIRTAVAEALEQAEA